jgi:iron complex outermembrane receptor protein
MTPGLSIAERAEMAGKTRGLLACGLPASAMTAVGLFIVGSTLALDASPAEAYATPQEYDIPGGPMTDALNRLADMSGAQLVYDAALTRNRKTHGVSGKRSLSEALDELLSGAGLAYKFDPSGKFVSIVLAQNDITRSDARAEALPPIDVGAEPRPTPRRSINGAEPRTPTEGYVVHDATAAMKESIPIRETPVSINVVPKQIIRDQAVTSLQGALENVSNVRFGGDGFSNYVYKIRGFSLLETYRNQLNMGDGNYNGADTANFERVEVLKGPSSILYGRAEPGGLINIVTKHPLFEPRYVIEQQIGNYDHYRTQWDFSAPVPDVSGLAWRLSGSYQDSRVFRDLDSTSRILVAPAVTYRPTPWTEFTADLQYVSAKSRVLSGIPVVGTAPANVPIWRTYQEPNDPRDSTDSFVASYVFRQNLNEDWKITNRFLFSSSSFSKELATPFGSDSAGATLYRYTQVQAIQGDAYSTNIDFEGKFDTFGAKHIFLFGLDYLNRNKDYYFGANNGAFGIPSGVFPIGVYSPVYGTIPPSAYYEALAGVGLKGHSSGLIRQKGMYAQDHVTFLDNRAHILLGLRYDVADVTNGSAVSVAGDFSATKNAAIANRLSDRSRIDTGLSPRFGVVYDLTPEISVYGSYTRSFGTGNSTPGMTLPPERGVQWEVGAKTQLLPDLSTTIAVFQLTKSNLTTANLATLDPTDYTLAGLQRSRGIEVDMIGAATDRLAVIANYAYIDAKVIADGPKDPLNPFGSGLYLDHLDNVPRHSGKVFLTYDFGEDGLGWRVGGGVTAATHAWGDIQNTFLIPGWARLDGFASYSTEVDGHRMTAQLNLNNITNTRYFTGSDSLFNSSPRLSVFPAQPFTAVGTLKFEW